MPSVADLGGGTHEGHQSGCTACPTVHKSQEMDGRIMRRGIISLRQSAATSGLVCVNLLLPFFSFPCIFFFLICVLLCDFHAKLDGQGRARRKAARRRKSEWKVNVAIPNSSRSNGSGQVTPKTVSLSIVEPRGIWTCVSLQCTSTSGGSICAL